MPADVIPFPETAPPPARRWTRSRVIAVLAAAILLGWWVATRPRSMRLVAAVPVATAADGVTLQPADDGLLVLHPSASAADDAIACSIDWHGNLRWTITPPPAKLNGWTIPSGDPCRVTVASPDGNVVVTLAPSAPGKMQLITWRNGIEQGRMTLAAGDFNTITNWPFPALHVLDDGRVLVYQSFARTSPLVLAQNSRVLARGAHAIRTPSNTGNFARAFSPDGTALVAVSLDEPGISAPFEYARVTRVGDRISAPVAYDGACPSAPPQVLDGGLFVTADGVVYDDTGEIYRHGTWETEPSAHPAIEHCVAQRRESQMLIFTPATRGLWAISAGDWITALSRDGRYALATHNGAATLGAWLRHPDGAPYTLRLFSRPGWLSATLPLTMTGDNALHAVINGRAARIVDYAVSERYQRVALLSVGDDGAPTLTLLRW